MKTLSAKARNRSGEPSIRGVASDPVSALTGRLERASEGVDERIAAIERTNRVVEAGVRRSPYERPREGLLQSRDRVSGDRHVARARPR